MTSDADWAALDRLADVIEHVYIARHRRRAARLVDGVPSEEATRVLDELTEALWTRGTYRNEAYAMALIVLPPRDGDEIDLRDRGDRGRGAGGRAGRMGRLGGA